MINIAHICKTQQHIYTKTPGMQRGVARPKYHVSLGDNLAPNLQATHMTCTTTFTYSA